MELMRINEVAEALRITRARAYELVRRGMLPSVRIGRQVRVHRGQLEEWIERGGVGHHPSTEGYVER